MKGLARKFVFSLYFDGPGHHERPGRVSDVTFDHAQIISCWNEAAFLLNHVIEDGLDVLAKLLLPH